MPIDRGPWNALIDDDGTNTSGTPWNKTAVKDVLLDPIDAMVPPPHGVGVDPADGSAYAQVELWQPDAVLPVC